MCCVARLFKSCRTNAQERNQDKGVVLKRYSKLGEIGEMSANTHSATRRRLLLAAPLASAAALAPTVSFASGTAPVGVLLPSNERIPGLRLDWRRGFQAELLAAGSSIRPQFVSYAVGSHRALQAAQSVLDQGCSTLTGIFSRNLATHLSDSLERRSARFLVSDLGANAVRRNHTCDGLTRVGPNLWQHAYLAGQHYAASGAKRALIATSFYEAGYDLPGAFEAGFMAAGGDRAHIVVTGTPEPTLLDDGFTRVSDALASSRFDVLFSLYSGREAARYLQFAQRNGFNASVGQMAALSTLLHGLPQSSANRASAMSMQIATAQSPGLGETGETIYTTMGRVAAHEVLASLDRACAAPAAWSVALVSVGGSSTAGTPVSLAPPWALSPTTVSSGWIAPYGA
jgi:hypothetical protein